MRCPQCGKGMGPVTAKEIPPANKFEECLRKCPRCNIGATNAKSPAKVKFIYGDQPPAKPAKPAVLLPETETETEQPGQTKPEPEEPAK